MTADRLNRKTLVVDTGTNIVALTPTSGQLAFCISTGSGFTGGILYRRDATNSAWDQIIDNASLQSLSNKTVNGGVFSGTIGGSPTFSGTPVFSGMPIFDNASDAKVVSAPANPSSGYARFYPRVIDVNNDGYFAKVKKANIFTEVRFAEKGFDVGNLLWASNDAEKVVPSGTYTKLKEITINRGGTLRIKFTLDGTHSSVDTWGKIYRNGFPIGTERSQGGTSAQEFSEDIAGWSVGDTVELWAKATWSAGQGEVENFRIYVDQLDTYTNTLV